jgi:hypothetical protein
MTSKTPSEKHPPCFGDLDTVFPEGEDGLRASPESCFACDYKTECLKTAMNGEKGDTVREEVLDRAYEAGMVGFLERWSKKKALHKKPGRKQRGRDKGELSSNKFNSET